VERATAIPAWITELLSGSITQQEGTSVLEINGKTIHRARILGVVVSTEELVIDDGTGSILVRTFDMPFPVQIGDIVLAIGRPRTYDNQPYLLGEIVKKIDTKWLELRSKQQPKPESKDKNADAISTVRSLDSGEGADYDKVAAKVGEELIVHLLAVGELFETRPGKLKVLE